MLTVALFIQWLHLCLSSIRRRAFCLHVITEDVDLMNFLELELLLIFFHVIREKTSRTETRQLHRESAIFFAFNGSMKRFRPASVVNQWPSGVDLLYRGFRHTLLGVVLLIGRADILMCWFPP